MGIKIMNKILNILIQYCRDVFINSIAASNFIPMGIRKIIYRLYGIDTKTKAIRPGCYFGGNKIEIGKHTNINGRCYFENLGKIEIGEHCNIAMEVLFCASTHEFGNSQKRAGKAYGKPIRVGNGCWIGARVVILPGVTVEDGCIIAAGSVVNKDCKANGLYVGVPAKRIKDLDEMTR